MNTRASADAAAGPTEAAGPAAVPCLTVRALHAGYGHTDVLHGVDLTLDQGRSMCLVGPNGAGKSTVLNAVFGLADVHRGQIQVGNADVLRLSAAARLRDAGVAYVLQDDAIFPDLSVEQNLRLGAYLVRGRQRIQDAVDRVLDRYPRLAARRKERAGVLSGGERRTLEIARALMMRPRLLLIDEPSIGLEPKVVVQIFDLLRALVAAGGTSVLMVEQNVHEGLKFADQGLVLVGGKVVAQGPGADLLHDRTVGQLFLGL
jgi:branched-chain amino acid transport system ATP-binding protein